MRVLRNSSISLRWCYSNIVWKENKKTLPSIIDGMLRVSVNLSETGRDTRPLAEKKNSKKGERWEVMSTDYAIWAAQQLRLAFINTQTLNSSCCCWYFFFKKGRFSFSFFILSSTFSLCNSHMCYIVPECRWDFSRTISSLHLLLECWPCPMNHTSLFK